MSLLPRDHDHVSAAHGRPEPDTLHGDEFAAQSADDLTIGGGGAPRRIGAGVILFLVLGVGAVASLWSMRAIGRASADDVLQSEAGRLVESYLQERSVAQTRGDGDALAAAPLPIGSAVDQQIPRENLARDPFSSPWKEASVTPSDASDSASHAASGLSSGGVAGEAAGGSLEATIAAWEASVDEGAHDFVVESVLVAADPKMSIVSMNGGVFRVGEHVMFSDRPIRYEIAAITQDAVTLHARSDELDRDRTVRLLIRTPR